MILWSHCHALVNRLSMATLGPLHLVAIGIIILTICAGAKVIEIPTTGLIDLSGRNLGPELQLTLNPASKTDRVHLSLLNVSGNPNLERIQLLVTVQYFIVTILDLTGTSVSPIPQADGPEGPQLMWFIPPKGLNVFVASLFINRTAHIDRPLKFPNFVNFIRPLRVENFILANWTVDGFETNFTEGKKDQFSSVAVRGAGIERLVNGVVRAPKSVDFRWNRISRVENVTFYSESVDFGFNRISQLINVTFLPGGQYDVLYTSKPEVLLNDNALTLEALDALATVNNSGKTNLLRGLNLSRNPLISRTTRHLTSFSQISRIRIAEWLHLDSVATDDVDTPAVERGLAYLLKRFEAGQKIDLDLSGNRLTSLTAVSRILVYNGLKLRSLRLARSSFSGPNLNLSELLPGLVSETELQFGDLTESSVRSLMLPVRRAAKLNATVLGDFDQLIQVAWSETKRVHVLPRPTSCCHGRREATVAEVFCFLRVATEDTKGFQARRRQVCRDDVHLGGDPLELPSPLLIFLCLAAALLTAAAVVTGGVLCATRLRRRRRARQTRRIFRSQQRPPGTVLEGSEPLPLKLGEKATLPGAVEED